MSTLTAGIPGYVAGTWDLDPGCSHVGFTARHLGLGRSAGTSRSSRRRSSPRRTRSSFRYPTIDLSSVNTIVTRDNDLRSGNFLNAGDYRPTGPPASGAMARISSSTAS